MTQISKGQSWNRLTASKLIIGGTVLSMVGCASTSSAPANIPNPFALPGAAAGTIQVNTLRVFGDSYSDPAYTKSRALLNWVDDVVLSGRAATAQSYAIGGAKAASGEVRSFDRQLATWASKNSPINDRDLTITYFGYNDIGRNGSRDNLAGAKAGYSNGIAQLVASGATTGNNRVFVTQIHDWSRNPGVNTANTQHLVTDINNYIGSLANANENIIAVDLYTVFNKILDNPTQYGFTNVSSAEPAKTTSTALFYDDIHFGSRGFQIVSRVYQHYLTRAWSWANAFGASAKASQQLNEDIDKGLLVLNMSGNNANIGTAFSLVPMGLRDVSTQRKGIYEHAFIPFASVQSTPKYSGLALNYKPQTSGILSDANFGIAFHQDDTETRINPAESSSSLSLKSNATSLYWTQPVAGFLLTNQLQQASLKYGQSASDDILKTSIANQRSGASWSFESKLRYTYANDLAKLTPWVSLSQSNQTLNAGALKSLYTSDVYYSSSSASQLISGIGMDLQFAPIYLNGGRLLQFGGRLSHRSSLNQDAITVAMRESSQPLALQRETIQQARINETYLGLNSELQLSRNVSLTAAYSANLNQRKSTEAVQVRANFSF